MYAIPQVRASGTDDTIPVIQESIQVAADKLVYRGKSLKIPFTREALIRVFGQPSREVYNTAGNIVIWDELGVTCFGCQKIQGKPEEFEFLTTDEQQTQERKDYVESITLFVRRYNPYPDQEKKYQHEPNLPFPGKIELDGVDIDGVTTFYEFLELRKGTQTVLLPENSFSFYIRCKPEPHEITLHTIRDKYDDDFMAVYSISIRNIGRYYRNAPCSEVFAPAAEQAQQTAQ